MWLRLGNKYLTAKDAKSAKILVRSNLNEQTYFLIFVRGFSQINADFSRLLAVFIRVHLCTNSKN